MSPAKKNQTKNEIQGVLFDWDGTLLDSFHADSSAYVAMFREMGIAWGLDQLAGALLSELVRRLPRRRPA